MAEGNTISIRDHVGAALRSVRESWRFVLTASGVGAVAIALLSGLGLVVAPLSILTSVASGFVHAGVYAAFVAAVLFGTQAVAPRLLRDTARVWAAMVVIGFFLFIVLFVISIPVMIVLLSGPMASYMPDLEAAGQDQAAVADVMVRFATENPGALLAVFLFYAAIWLLLTSRLYLAAPASVDQQRILTFETWKWTKGSMLRIIGARLLLLVPANILSSALSYLAGRAVGVDSFDMAATAAAVTTNPAGFITYILVSTLLSLALFSALEAALSTHIYRALKPAAASAPA